MSDDQGQISRDLRTLGRLDPAEAALPPEDRETRIQRNGRIALIGGIALIVGALFTSVGLAIATDGPTFDNPVAQMWGILALITVMTLGGTLLTVGATERRQRPERAMLREVMRHLQALDQHSHSQTAAVEQIGRAIDLIAEHMPENQMLHHWRGHAAAIRQSLAADTGTDGPGRNRQPHLGLVGRNDPPAASHPGAPVHDPNR